jgi:hypothetical protein
VFS